MSFNINCRYFKQVARSMNSFNWYQKFFMIFCQILSMKVWDSLQFYQRKTLNLSYVIGIVISLFSFHLYYYQQNKAQPQRKEVAKIIYLKLLALTVVKWLLYYKLKLQYSIQIFFQQTSGNLAFRDLSYRPLTNAIIAGSLVLGLFSKCIRDYSMNTQSQKMLRRM